MALTLDKKGKGKFSHALLYLFILGMFGIFSFLGKFWLSPKGKAMKTIQLRAVSSEEARELLGELYAEEFREGDRAEVTYPGGKR